MKLDVINRKLLKVSIALRHCTHCGRLVKFRWGVMEEHKGDGRGGVCAWYVAQSKEGRAA